MPAKAAPATNRLTPRAAAAVRGTREKDTAQPAQTKAELREVRAQLELLCEMLLWPSPQVLENCDSRLASVTRDLEASRPGWANLAGDTAAAEEARRAWQALKNIRRLLDRAAEFYSQWHRICAAMTGYRADGAPERIPCRARIVAEG